MAQAIDLEDRRTDVAAELVEPDLNIPVSVKPQLSMKGNFGERADEDERSAIFE